MTAAELLERGIRAYTRGSLEEAERCWAQVLSLDPKNERARAYLDVLVKERGVALPLPAPSAPAATAPAPAPARDTQPGHAPPLPPAAASAPVPLPSRPITQPGWMKAPVTLVPGVPPAEAAPPPPAAVTAVAGNAAVAAAPPMPRQTLAQFVPSPWDEGPARAPALMVEDGAGLDLATVEEQSDVRPLVPDSPTPPRRAMPRSDVEVWMEAAREMFALGDFSGSLEMIERILKLDPNHTEARLYLEQNEATLTAMYESKLGPQTATPRLAIQPEEVMWLNLDHRAGFLLAQIDGTVTYEDLFSVSGLPRLDTARILATLLQEHVIASH